MILYTYHPYSEPKIVTQEVEPMKGHPELFSFTRGRCTTTGTLDALENDGLFRTPERAVESRVETQKRVLESEGILLKTAQRDLERIRGGEAI